MEELRKESFPALLGHIPDPPKKLYLKGVLPPDSAKFLCVVGSRKHTQYGKEAAERLIEGLRGYDIAIVSGLALGIDAVAHRAALKAGLATVAVPGSGLDERVLYPRSHVGLAREILGSGGALLSEYEPMFRATAWSFPRRNRIMAGMSHAVLVVEAETRSGTLITSKLATEYGRDVFAVPGSIFSRMSEGPHMLHKLGAAPIRTAEDILAELGFGTDGAPVQKALLDLLPDEQRVFELLGDPLPRDLLIQRLSMPTSQANILLSAMEIKGLITESLGEIRIA